MYRNMWLRWYTVHSNRVIINMTEQFKPSGPFSPVAGEAMRLGLVLEQLQHLPRRAVEVLVEALIERLDRSDGDPDLEDDDPAEQDDHDEIDDDDSCSAFEDVIGWDPVLGLRPWLPGDGGAGDPDDAECDDRELLGGRPHARRTMEA